MKKSKNATRYLEDSNAEACLNFILNYAVQHSCASFCDQAILNQAKLFGSTYKRNSKSRTIAVCQT